jgi:Anti-sigma factor NepR
MYRKSTPEDSLDSALVREQIGRSLRNHYQACTSQELPPRLLALLKKLDQELREVKDQ